MSNTFDEWFMKSVYDTAGKPIPENPIAGTMWMIDGKMHVFLHGKWNEVVKEEVKDD